MKKFYIVANPDKENTKNMQAAIEKYLKAHGAGVSLGKSVSGHGNPYTDPEEVPADTECVITLGGDGTLIQAARDLAGRDLPMIGINLGGLGYLTQIGREGDVKELLDALLEDSYQIQERMMLKGCVYRDGRPVKALMEPDGEVVCLIKPQFEAGREKVGKKGVVREKSVHLEVIEMVASFAGSIGFEALHLEFSPIKGPEGNIEYLLHLRNCTDGSTFTNDAIGASGIVDKAHETLDK